MKNRCIGLILVLLASIAGSVEIFAQANAGGLPATIRTDGVYQAPGSKPQTFGYLRFYGDGTVVEASSTGTPVDVAKWISKSHEYSGVGQVTGDAKTIAFSAKSKSGVVDFQGRVEKDGLSLTTYSHINRFRGSYFYKFVPVAFPSAK